MAASAARSAAVTGLRSALSTTASGWRKAGRIASPAASAKRIARARKASRSISGTSLFQRVEIGDDIGAILRLGHAGEGHLGALDQGLRLPQPLVQLVGIPFLVLVRLHRRRKLVVRDGRHVLLGDAPQVRADLVGAALIEGVALDADLGE